jgi:endonuclease/exonuclease/phosphatase family metal-dependent hydrolase
MQLSIATLNILGTADRWSERQPLIEAAFASLAPDVLALQEVQFDVSQAEGIASAGHDRYATLRAREKPDFGNALLVQSPLTAADGGGDLEGCEVDLGGGRAAAIVDLEHVRLVSTHLHWVPDETEKRLEQIQRLLGALQRDRSERPTIIAGDLNATPDEPACEALRDAGFRSSYATANGAEPEWTYPTPATPADVAVRPPSCIDYIWVGGAIEVVDARTAFDEPTDAKGRLYPSDHRGIVATLRF